MPSTQRLATINLLRSSIPLEPDAPAIQAALASRDLDWNDALYLADGHGLTPLLYNTWRALGVHELIPDEARARMEQAYRDNTTRNADARRDFAEIMALMAQTNVETIVLKGLPLLDALYDDPAERVLYDFDLLAQDEPSARRGFDALLSAGFTRVPTKAEAFVTKHLPSVWRLDGFVRRGYLYDVAQPRPVELHLTLWDDNWRGLKIRNLDDLWQRGRGVRLNAPASSDARTSGGTGNVPDMHLRVLSDEDTLIHLSVHFATHVVEREARVGQLIDVARFMQRRGASLDWAYILRASSDARVTRFVYLALKSAHMLLGAPLPTNDVVGKLSALAPLGLRQWVEQNAANDLLEMDYRKPELKDAYALTFAATQSLAEKLGVVRFALLPPREVLAQQYNAAPNAFPLPLYARHFAERGRVYLKGTNNQ
jgi:hypothetical protein